MKTDIIYNLDCIQNLNLIDDNSIHLILSDIPYGIGIDDWDVLHENTNSAFLGQSPAQTKAGAVFRRRGKPLNGWSNSDKTISNQYYDWCLTWTKKWFGELPTAFRRWDSNSNEFDLSILRKIFHCFILEATSTTKL